MDDPDDRQGFSRNPTVDDLVQLCKSLNEAGVRYVVVGGFAVAHHGYIRTTGDIDPLPAFDLSLRPNKAFVRKM
ncbi:MAG: hypothetical protein MPW14_03260 [Candidatus Manganitrophus sp.]|nr:hypothetical protein [Candidatus Manganitrophus sp.]MDC4227062.1 hypothetical protein [Candidatus Manganitrophus sp.]WDT71803.1 MAG: hypothetical protein MPW17_02860 [Candidatus Manganitrophus sp.]WDT80816.1 MAG: hypothetical protein MPW14_03260 [Candidatus Manganitrophus sp.]